MRPFVSILAALAFAAAGLAGVAAPASASVPDWDRSAHHVPLFDGKGHDLAAKSSKTASALSTTPIWVYAGGHQVLGSGVTAQGALANVLVAEPWFDSTNDGHSLAEIAARDTATGNTIEIGWTVDPFLNANSQAYLFSGAWKNGVFLGYNATATGYVDYGPNPINVGANLHSVVIDPTFTNRIKKMYIYHDTTVACGSDQTGGWWIYYDTAYVGCYQNSIWSGAFTSVNNAEYFGEVPTWRTSGKPCSDGGNGRPGSSAVLPLDASDPAFFGSTSWVNPSPAGTTSVNTLFNSDNLGNNTGGAYDAFNIGSTGNRTFTYGGKGWTNTGTLPGNYAAC